MRSLDVSYLRVSTANQRDAETIETQRHALTRYFEQHGIKPQHQFEDDGVSGGIEVHRRPQGSKLYQLIDEGHVNRLFVFSLDRIGRDTIDTLLFLRLTENHGTRVIGISDGTDTARHGSTLETEIRAVIGAQYKRDCTQRTKAGLRCRAAEDGKISTRPPFGFRSEDGRMVVDDAKAEVMKAIFKDVARGIKTKEIVTRLNESCAPSPTGRGWRHDTVIYLLKHRAYAGEYLCFTTPKRRPGGGPRIARDPQEAITINCPTIISRELFDVVQEQLAFNRRWCANGGKRVYLLKSLIRCGHCGLTYVGHAIVGRHYRDRVYPDVRYYECGSVSNRDYKFCGNVRLNADKLEKAVWGNIEKFIESPSRIIEQLVARYTKRANLEAKNAVRDGKALEIAKRKNIEARQRLVMKVARGVISDEDARLGFNELAKEAEALLISEASFQKSRAEKGKSKRIVANAQILLSILRKRLDEGLTPEKKVQIIRQLVKNVVVKLDDGKAAVTIEYFFPNPPCFAPVASAFSASSRKK
jgi:site-specific DNA recombinase